MCVPPGPGQQLSCREGLGSNIMAAATILQEPQGVSEYGRLIFSDGFVLCLQETKSYGGLPCGKQSIAGESHQTVMTMTWPDFNQGSGEQKTPPDQ